MKDVARGEPARSMTVSPVADTPPMPTPTLPLRGAEPEDVAIPEPSDPDARHWSVTTIIKVLDKPALVPWAAKATALEAVRKADTLKSIEDSSGTDEAVRWLSAARYRTPQGERQANDLGTLVHECAEEYALTGKRPELADDPEIRPFFEQFDRWLQRFTPSFQAVESTVYSSTYGYAGTSDCFLTIDGVRLIGDYKTTKRARDYKDKPSRPFPEVALQLAAYRHAEFAALWRPRRFEQFKRRYYLLSNEERRQAIKVPEVDGGVCIHITPENCEAFPVRCDARAFEAFLFVLEVARWQFQDSRDAIGDPLVPAGELADVLELSLAQAQEGR